MADTILFNGKVPASFTPSKGFAITARRVVLHFLVTVTGSPTSIACYLEYAGAPSQWFRETIAEDGGNGALAMPAVVRTLAPAGGGNLPVGVTALTISLTSDEQLARVQLACPGNATVELTTPYALSGRAI